MKVYKHQHLSAPAENIRYDITNVNALDVPDTFVNNRKICITDSGYSVSLPDRYSYYTGTSMAPPHVSGVAALIWSYYPTQTEKEIWNALAESVHFGSRRPWTRRQVWIWNSASRRSVEPSWRYTCNTFTKQDINTVAVEVSHQITNAFAEKPPHQGTNKRYDVSYKGTNNVADEGSHHGTIEISVQGTNTPSISITFAFTHQLADGITFENPYPFPF